MINEINEKDYISDTEEKVIGYIVGLITLIFLILLVHFLLTLESKTVDPLTNINIKNEQTNDKR